MSAMPDRILTTHVGSLPRPEALVAMLLAEDRGEAHDAGRLAAAVHEAVVAVVARQVEAGVDVVSDGEMGKISYANYVKHRLSGFGDPAPLGWTPQDLADHPEYDDPKRKAARAANPDPPACRAAVAYADDAPLAAEIADFRGAVDAAAPAGAFLNAASPGVVAHFLPNRFYPDEDAYVAALADALQPEYEAIHAAGFQLQIDCPDLAMVRHMSFAGRPLADFRRAAARNVEALNHATRNIPGDAMRLHLCWGNYPGPHTHDVPLRDVADIVFAARPRTVLFEGANPRHAHEWAELDPAAIPDDVILVPGVIETNSQTVEHPALVAQRLCHWAGLVGRERVMAGTDCGFATFAGLPTVWPSVVWDKLRAMAEGAAIASDRLWGRG